MAEKIEKKNSSDQFIEDYRRYGLYVLFRRILSDYRDGLKPVQRRIIIDLFKDSKAIKGKTIKCAAIAGDVVKLYHPHGDVSVYDSMKPLANWFECKVPLITPQGNFGTFQGDPAADRRYTECCLSQFGYEAVISELVTNLEAVDWRDNYTGDVKEPEFLPSAVPLLLINGSFGIGIGMKAEIPSHSLIEVIDAVLTLISDPMANITLIPDTCMPCEIMEIDTFEDISNNGYGKYKVRGLMHQETYSGDKPKFRGHQTLVIDSVPDMTYLNTITDKIETLVANKKIIQIEACFDECSNNKLRYVIILKQGADPNFVKSVIYKNTDLEKSVVANFMFLNGGLEPVHTSYREYLLAFIEFRKTTKFRLYTNELQRIQTKIHERDAYIKAMESGQIDTIIAMIRKQKTVEDKNATVEWLIKMLNITDLQAEYILGIDVRRLAAGYLTKYKAEAIELENQRQITLAKILDERIILEEIINELNYFKKKYGSRRLAKVVEDTGTENIPKGMMQIVLTGKNFIKKVPANSPIGNFKGDYPKMVKTNDNTKAMIVFDDMGKVFKLPVHKIEFTDRNSNGIDSRFLIKGLSANICTMFNEDLLKNMSKSKGPKYYVAVLTRSGMIKKMDIDDFLTIPVSGIIYSKLDSGDAVVDIKIISDKDGVVVYSDRKALYLSVADIPHLKRNTKGSRAMTTDTVIDGMSEITGANNVIVVVTESGYVNKFDISMLPVQKARNKDGFNIIKLGPKDKIFSVHTAIDQDILAINTINTKLEFVVGELKPGSSISGGDKIIPLRGDKIINSYMTNVRGG